MNTAVVPPQGGQHQEQLVLGEEGVNGRGEEQQQGADGQGVEQVAELDDELAEVANEFRRGKVLGRQCPFADRVALGQAEVQRRRHSGVAFGVGTAEGVVHRMRGPEVAQDAQTTPGEQVRLLPRQAAPLGHGRVAGRLARWRLVLLAHRVQLHFILRGDVRLESPAGEEPFEVGPGRAHGRLVQVS